MTTRTTPEIDVIDVSK